MKQIREIKYTHRLYNSQNQLKNKFTLEIVQRNIWHETVKCHDELQQREGKAIQTKYQWSIIRNRIQKDKQNIID